MLSLQKQYILDFFTYSLIYFDILSWVSSTIALAGLSARNLHRLEGACEVIAMQIAAAVAAAGGIGALPSKIIKEKERGEEGQSADECEFCWKISTKQLTLQAYTPPTAALCDRIS